MKNLIIILLTLFSITANGQNRTSKVSPQLRSVHLFTTSAHLFFENEIELQKGITEIVIKQLPTKLDEKTLNIQLGNKDVEIISLSHIKNPVKSIDNFPVVKKLDFKIAELEKEKAIQEMHIKTLEKEKELLFEMLKNNQTGLDNALNYYQTKNKRITNEIVGTTDKIKSINSRIDSLFSENEKVDKVQRALLSELVVKVKTESSVSSKILYHFIVKDAGWVPAYDFKVKYKEKNMEILQKADVYNNTGVDWNKIPLVLSTAQPVLLTNIPQLLPMHFGRNEYIQDNYELKKETFEYRLKAEKEKLKLKTFSVPEFVINYELKERYKIPSDKKPYTVNINKIDVNYQLQYIAVPKVDESVYLSAKVPGWAELNLLDGDACVFLDGALITKTYIKNKDQDTFNISLGQVNTVKVKRNKIDVKTGKSMIGSKVKYNFGFEIVAENFNSFPIELKIMDQVPVSTDKSVDVEVFDISSALKDIYGILTWKMTLQPKEKQIRNFAYSIKYPEGKNYQRRRVSIPCPAF